MRTIINPAYNFYSEGDCTNFVSQAVVAGGLDMYCETNPPTGINDTTRSWYSLKYGNSWRESTSWIRVAEFFEYWVAQEAWVSQYKTVADLNDNVQIGDVVQLKYWGKWYHSIIITGFEDGEYLYCGHTDPRNNVPISKIKRFSDFRVISLMP